MKADSSVTTDCDPIVTNKDLGFKYAFDKTTELVPDEVAFPCGLVAKSYFNDTFILSKYKTTGDDLTIDSTDIAWKSDREFKFKNMEGDWESK